ncbi:hypothetical protein QE152_g23148 [Popillia japonica]|uniref:Uncharacterized protein n=1 Tax=Popillia japonica TaxID=7064 RepID=A0AAW1KIG4_POPJA
MNSVHSSGGSTHHYAVTHHYHNAHSVGKNTVAAVSNTVPCQNITFCPPNSYPLCLSNGTIYCIGSMEEVFNCEVNSIKFSCINTTLSTPCLHKDQSVDCKDSTVIKNETVQLPCVSNLFVMGNFSRATVVVPTTVFQYKGTDVEVYCIVVIADPVLEEEEDNGYIEIIAGVIFLSLIAFYFLYSSYEEKMKRLKANEQIAL